MEIQTADGWVIHKPPPDPAIDHFIDRICLAVVARAVRDAAEAYSPDDEFDPLEARDWLLSEHAIPFLELLSIPRSAIRAWVLSGAEIPPWARRKSSVKKGQSK